MSHGHSDLVVNVKEAHRVHVRRGLNKVKNNFTPIHIVVGTITAGLLDNQHITERVAIFTGFTGFTANSNSWTRWTACFIGSTQVFITTGYLTSGVRSIKQTRIVTESSRGRQLYTESLPLVGNKCTRGKWSAVGCRIKINGGLNTKFRRG